MKSEPNEILECKDREEWLAWLREHHADSSGVWMRIAKAKSDLVTVSHKDALNLAVCYGWIDAIKRPESERSWLQRWTPRKAKSLWSKINVEKAEALIKSGEMQPAGLREVERAKADGRWEAAYQRFSSNEVPADLEAELEKSPKAREFFEQLDRANRYAIVWRLQTAAKPETRAKRLAKFVEMLENGERIHDISSKRT